MRIRQEMVLGIGGVRALTALGKPPTVCHMNEGHSARMRSMPQKALCPSFMWQTVGDLPRARRARTPPMPSTISWRMRVSVSPP